MAMTKIIFFLSTLLFLTTSQAGELSLNDAKIQLKVPYTMGTHTLKASQLSGSLQWSESRQQLLSGELILAVQDIAADDETLRCHLLESLTLDYTKSDFPKKHVCEGDKLPLEGKNAPVYSNIKVRLAGPFTLTDNAVLVEWEIHGVKKEQTLPLEIKLSEDKKTFTLKANFKLKRSDFGIVVKKFLFIDADDKLPIEVEITGDTQ